MEPSDYSLDNTASVIDPITEDEVPQFHTPTESEKELLSFVVEHTDDWREYRDQNYLDDWLKYERIFKGEWASEDKQRGSERSRVVSPATQQAIETRHAEIMEGVFGQGEFFDIQDDVLDVNGTRIDAEQIKNQLNEAFKQDKIRLAIDHIALLAEIYGTGIGEITVGKEKLYKPATMPLDQNTAAYGVQESERVSVKLVPVNPKNFLFDPNGQSIDDCMGVAIERYVSIHKIGHGIATGKYLNVDIGTLYEDDSLESTVESKNFEKNKIKVLTYYGLVPKEYLKVDNTDVVDLFGNEKEKPEVDDGMADAFDDYADMVEAIIVIANDSVLLKAEESPYMMKDRPVIAFQADTVPGRLLGRGTAAKAFNMQVAIDAQMRSHLDALALTTAPMVAVDATRLPRGAKFEVKPGKAFLTNGAPSEIIMPFHFGTNDGQAMTTSKEFERLLLMATATLDSQGMVSAGSRDGGGLAPAVAGIIKKYRRVLTNIQEQFIIPFVNKAAWRYMQFSPETFPSVDVKFIPTATLGVIAREYEQQQLAFLIQTLGANSPMTPILMQGIVANSSLSNREKILDQMAKASQPDPQAQQLAIQKDQVQVGLVQAQSQELQAKAQMHQATAQKFLVDSQIAPEKAKADIMSAISRNLPDQDAAAQMEFDRRAKIAELMLKEEDIKNNRTQVEMQMAAKSDRESQKAKDKAYLDSLIGG